MDIMASTPKRSAVAVKRSAIDHQTVFLDMSLSLSLLPILDLVEVAAVTDIAGLPAPTGIAY
jgi:hypothetical protein